MLILPDFHPDRHKKIDSSILWPGPICICTRDKDRLDVPELGEIQRDHFLFDTLGQKLGTFSLIRSIALSTRGTRAAPKNAILVIRKSLQEDAARAIEREALENGFAIKFSCSESGDVEWLLIGKNIIRNKLFMTFCRNMTPCSNEQGFNRCVEVIKEHLVPA